jgi:hypothetical protein
MLTRFLRHLPVSVITFLTEVFNAVRGREYFLPPRKHARVLPTLKPWKDPTLPSSYRIVRLFETVSKFCEKILLTRVIGEINRCSLLHDKHFGFQPRHSTKPQLEGLFERIKRNFDERRLTGAVSLNVAKAFNTVKFKCLHYKLTVLNFPSSPVKTIPLYLACRKSATSTRSAMRAGLTQSGLVYPALFLVYVNDVATLSRQRSTRSAPQSVACCRLPGEFSR